MGDGNAQHTLVTLINAVMRKNSRLRSQTSANRTDNNKSDVYTCVFVFQLQLRLLRHTNHLKINNRLKNLLSSKNQIF